MLKAEHGRIEDFRRKVVDWFKHNGRSFVWREDSATDYLIIVAEVFLQRTKAETVEDFIKSFVIKYPSWESIIRVNISELQVDLIPIGLYKQKGQRLQNLANTIIGNKGIVPAEYDQLITMPMIGQYIANAILSVVHDRPYPMLDGTMARLIERYYGARKLVDIRYDKELQELAYRLVNVEKSKVVNWAVLDYGSIICKRMKPLCSICIISDGCQYYNSKIKIND